MLKNISENLSATLHSKILKKYKGKKHFAFLHFQRLETLEYYSLYIVERAGETGTKYKKEFYQTFSIDCPIREIEKIIKEKIGEFGVLGGNYAG